jgi:hypothetical protein
MVFRMTENRILIEKMDEKSKRDLEEGIENKKWIKKNYSSLKKEYPNCFIAVKDRKIIAARKDLNELRKILNEQYPNDNEIAIEYINKIKSYHFFVN